MPPHQQFQASYYYNVVDRLCSRQLLPGQIAPEIAHTLSSVRLSPDIIVQLRVEAEQCVWSAPRRSWALAHVSIVLARELAQGSLLAECCPVLLIATNALGRFSETPTLFESVTDVDLACASRCYSEVALAYVYLGRFEMAQTYLAQARDSLTGLNSPVAPAYCNRVEGRLRLAQNRYKEAVQLFQQAEGTFMAFSCQEETALVRLDLAETLIYTDPSQALNWLSQAHHTSLNGNTAIHSARCHHAQALIYYELNRYTESLPLFSQAKTVFGRAGLEFLMARCDLDHGLACYRLNRYDEAIRLYQQARLGFIELALPGYAAICDLNIANVYYDKNNYSEALTIYQQVAEIALIEGRPLRVARCYTNMGLCYDRLGHYNQALLLHRQAQQAFLEAGSPLYAALCQEHLAGTYHALGHYEGALAHYQQAREIFATGQFKLYLARCNTQLADLYLSRGQPAEAQACLQEARQVCGEAGMDVYQAACDRLLAQATHALGHPETALVQLSQARLVFSQREMLVEIALCDLAEAEIHLAQGRVQQAAGFYKQARTVLVPGFPDQAWLAEAGLGRCALIHGDRIQALEYYLKAANFIRQSRDTLPTERLSGAFFASRQPVLQAAITLAFQLKAVEQALELVEASKARVFPTRRHSTRQGSEQSTDPYLTRLVAREVELRQQLQHLRRQFLGQGYAIEVSDHQQLDSRFLTQRPDLKELLKLYLAYEEVVDQLRMATRTTTGATTSSFSLTAFRESAAIHLPPGWACLEYFLTDHELIMFYLDAQTLRVYQFRLTPEDKRILQECSNPQPERRALIYQDALHGFPIPGSPSQAYRRHLGQLLFPSEVLTTNPPSLLIISPHGQLHNLPFHALLVEETLLLEHFSFLYTPSLQTLQMLWAGPMRESLGTKPLICGVTEFATRARPLLHAYAEMQAVSGAFVSQAQLLYGPEATVAALKNLSVSGELADYDLIHFATHTIIEPVAPLLSRVLLADNDLTVAEILELDIGARLVTLSTCQSALGDTQPGDETMTIARAFFHAGAQAVVASLWAVEDEATAILMQHFYQRLESGDSMPQALRQAQIAMHHEGYTAYQWAPFVAIGLP